MKKNIYKIGLIISVLCFAIIVGAGIVGRVKTYAGNVAEDISMPLKASIVMDSATNTILYEKNSNNKLQVASMTKIMTLLIAFDYLNDNKIALTDKITISNFAASVEGSQAFLDAGAKYSLDDILKSIIICSANDSCVALAEFIAGDEQNFVKMMNDKAELLLLKNTCFINSTGLPAVGHYSSAYDIATIYNKLCKNELYTAYSKIWMDTLVHPSGRKTGLVNTNRLIKTYNYNESGKTGHTIDAGYCLVSASVKDNMKVITVVIGAETSKIRFDSAKVLANYAFNSYISKTIVKEYENPITINIKGSDNKSINAVPNKNFIVLCKKTDDEKFKISYETYELKAPICKGDNVGKIYVYNSSESLVAEIDLVAEFDAPKIKISTIFNKILELM